MIIWIASYPKSGNTFVRSILSAYYFTKNGEFNFNLLENIKQFPDRAFFDEKIESLEHASKSWLLAQKKIIDNKKIKFLKTHNQLGSYKGNLFTVPKYTLGSIYIVRDPRNIFTSLKNHFSQDDSETLNMLTDEDRGIKSDIDDDYSTYSFIGSWKNHYKSWINTNQFRTMIIKYEDLQKNIYETVRDMIVFTNTLMNKREKVNKEKLMKCIETTKFINLKNEEIQKGFSEAIYSEKKNKKVPFFNMGFNNRYHKLLSEDLVDKLNNEFTDDLKFFGY